MTSTGKPYRGPIHKKKADAEKELSDLKEVLAERRYGDEVKLTKIEQLDARHALRIAAKYSYSLTQMCEIAERALDRERVQKTSTLREAWERLKLAVEAKGSSDAHKEGAAWSLGFAERRGCPHLDMDLRDIDVEAAQTWLDSVQASPTTKRAYLTYARMVYVKAIREKYSEASPYKDVQPPAIPRTDTTHLKPDQAQALLRATDPRDLPFVAVAMFAGLRPHSEIVDRKWRPVLMWEHLDWERLEIQVPAATKTGARIVPMEPALVAFLTPHRQESGPVTHPGLRKRLEAARKAAGITWSQDVLRHTYGTMWLSAFEDRAKLVERMGNSEAVLKHYRHPISRSVAESFWAIRP